MYLITVTGPKEPPCTWHRTGITNQLNLVPLNTFLWYHLSHTRCLFNCISCRRLHSLMCNGCGFSCAQKHLVCVQLVSSYNKCFTCQTFVVHKKYIPNKPHQCRPAYLAFHPKVQERLKTMHKHSLRQRTHQERCVI